jgi:hypothetical protein
MTSAGLYERHVNHVNTLAVAIAGPIFGRRAARFLARQAIMIRRGSLSNSLNRDNKK